MTHYGPRPHPRHPFKCRERVRLRMHQRVGGLRTARKGSSRNEEQESEAAHGAGAHNKRAA